MIDGSGFLFRAFHALPPLTGPNGLPTGAVLGVANMVRRLLDGDPRQRIAMVFDHSGPSFRNALYPAYKANRPPTPPELRAQKEPLEALIVAMGIPLLKVPEVEADDVIATLTTQALAAGFEVVIATNDKDLAQLIAPGVRLIDTMNDRTLDRDAIVAKFGVEPEQIVDFLTLTGDSSDNVPGVPKCGPKTAAKWLAEYRSLDALVADAAKIPGKVGEALREALPTLALSRQLVTVKRDVALDLEVGELQLRTPDAATGAALVEALGFDSWRSVFKAPAKAPAATPPSTPTVTAASVDTSRYQCINDSAALAHFVQRLAQAPRFAFDTETAALDALDSDLVGLAFAVAPNEACYIPLGHRLAQHPQLPMAEVLAAVGPLLADRARSKVAQHGKYDRQVLARYGIEVAGHDSDPMLQSYVLNPGLNRHNMDVLAERWLGHRTIRFEDVAGKGAKQLSFADVDIEAATRYSAEDADITLRLADRLDQELAAVPALATLYRELEIPLIDVLDQMERTGVLLDTDHLAQLSRRFDQQMLTLKARAEELAGQSINLDSPKQLQQVLFDKLGLRSQGRTATGQASTNEEALEELADQHELPRIVLAWRSLAKLKGTYTDKLPRQVRAASGRVHTHYNQAVAATGRLSSTDPNLQNIPIRSEDGRAIRQAFIAPPGHVVMAADYSQIELRIMAHLSADEGLLGAFARGEDIHRATAAEVYATPLKEVSNDQRRAAKAVNFGLIYGMSAFGLARQLGIGRGEAKTLIDRYFARYPGVRRYMDQTRELARRQGYVETVFGRRLYLPEINSRAAGLRAGAERAAINAPMQGTAADLIKRAMLAVHRWLGPRPEVGRMLMQVHDELVFEIAEAHVDEARAQIRHLMASAGELRVPLIVDVGVGANWDQAH